MALCQGRIEISHHQRLLNQCTAGREPSSSCLIEHTLSCSHMRTDPPLHHLLVLALLQNAEPRHSCCVRSVFLTCWNFLFLHPVKCLSCCLSARENNAQSAGHQPAGVYMYGTLDQRNKESSTADERQQQGMILFGLQIENTVGC
jgi:hypothetical protein